MPHVPPSPEAARSESWISRLWPLLHWQTRYDVRRRETWISAAGTIGICVFALLTAVLGRRMWGAGPPGKMYFESMRRFLCFITPAAALSSTSAIAQDLAGGILALVRVSDLRPSQWIAYRLAAAVLTFLPAWAVRLPFYTLAYGLGGVTVSDIVAAEVLQWAAFIVVASVGMLAGHSFNNSQVAGQTAMWSLVGFLMLFEAPRWIVSMVQSLYPSAGRWLDDAEVFSLSWSRLSLARQVFTPPVDAAGWTVALISIAIHLIVASAAIWMLHRTLFAAVGADPAPDAVAEPKLGRVMRRARRRPRPWTDALAWQVFWFRHTGTHEVYLKTAIYGVVVLVALGSLSFSMPLAILLSATTAFGVVFYYGLQPGDTLQCELKDGTLSAFAMLPDSGLDAFRGWLRGARRLCVAEFIWMNLCAAALVVWEPRLVAVWLAIIAMLALLPPLVFLAYLQRFTGFWGSLRSCLPILCLVLIVAGSSLIAGIVDIWIGLASFVVASSLAHWESIRRIPDAFRRRVEGAA